jgi:uncharacterized protein YutE (UPF0331/DUF86 family)
MTKDRIVYRRLQKIRENLDLLRSAAEAPVEKFVSDALLYSATEHAVQVSIQAVIDICAYLVKRAQAHMPEEYRDLPLLASRLGVFPEEFAKRLVGMVGMRNVLVHMYLDVDLTLVHRMLQENLDDFNEFARYVDAYLEREGIA